MHDLLAQEQQTLADVQLLQHRKDDIRRQRPQIIAQIVLTSLVRLPAPHERAYHYLRERLIQEEAAALHHLNWCRSRYVGLSGQIATIDTEIALLLTHP